MQINEVSYGSTPVRHWKSLCRWKQSVSKNTLVMASKCRFHYNFWYLTVATILSVLLKFHSLIIWTNFSLNLLMNIFYQWFCGNPTIGLSRNGGSGLRNLSVSTSMNMNIAWQNADTKCRKCWSCVERYSVMFGLIVMSHLDFVARTLMAVVICLAVALPLAVVIGVFVDRLVVNRRRRLDGGYTSEHNICISIAVVHLLYLQRHRWQLFNFVWNDRLYAVSDNIQNLQNSMFSVE